MDLAALGEACDELCAIHDDRDRARDPFGVWLNGYRHYGIYALTHYFTRHEDGYLSHGSTGTINWVAGEDVYLGYPSERPGGARNFRYEVPADAYLPTAQRELAGQS
jgi:hypothetical protein